jgi:hypothetical protein
MGSFVGAWELLAIFYAYFHKFLGTLSIEMTE